MGRQLCISVTFLDPLFHGKGDDKVPEWPPSPMRLFQALLAGSRTGCCGRQWSDTKTEAFRWLERQDPPVVVTPATRRATALRLFVPNNDSDKKFDRQDRLTSKIVHPHRLLDGDTLHYLWAIDEGQWDTAKSHAELLCAEARCLLALGWGIDQVVGNGRILTDAEAAALPGQRWRAWEVHRPGQQMTRTPVADSLDNLEQVHRSFLDRIKDKQYRPSLKLRKFGTVAYVRQTVLPARPCAVFELPDGVSFRQEDAVKVAAMLRSLTCRLAKADTHKFPGGSELYVAGHVEDDSPNHARFSYLPLPTIGHPHADGMVRRLLIAEPFGGDGRCARWAQQRLRNAILKDEDGNERGILLDPWRPGSNEMIRGYVGKKEGSRTWCTVTPVILPGYDDVKAITQVKNKSPLKAERLLFKCLVHAGIPLESVAGVTLRRAPFWPGSQHPKLYRRPDYLADQHARPGWHVRLVFHEPVSGPLSIGAGRHIGLGIFAAMER
jgi:CRISPR-associated protein Csb2